MEKQNPYRAPQVSTTQAPVKERRRKLHVAGKSKRVLNVLIDGLVSAGLTMAVFFAYVLLRADAIGQQATSGVDSASLLFIAALPCLYYFGMELALGRTVGKFLTGTRVVDVVGRKPSAGAIAGRTLCRLIPLEWVTFLLKDSGLHDTLSGTRVVLASRLEEQE